MREVNIYLDAKYINDKDEGAFGYYIESESYRFSGGGGYYRTSCPRMEMRACIEAMKQVLKDFGSGTRIHIHTKQYALIRALIRGRTKASKDNTNQDLYMEAKVSLSLVCCIEENLNMDGIYKAQRMTITALEQENKQQDRPDKTRAIPLF